MQINKQYVCTIVLKTGNKNYSKVNDTWNILEFILLIASV